MWYINCQDATLIFIKLHHSTRYSIFLLELLCQASCAYPESVNSVHTQPSIKDGQTKDHIRPLIPQSWMVSGTLKMLY